MSEDAKILWCGSIGFLVLLLMMVLCLLVETDPSTSQYIFLACNVFFLLLLLKIKNSSYSMGTGIKEDYGLLYHVATFCGLPKWQLTNKSKNSITLIIFSMILLIVLYGAKMGFEIIFLVLPIGILARAFFVHGQITGYRDGHIDGCEDMRRDWLNGKYSDAERQLYRTVVEKTLDKMKKIENG